MRNNMVSLEFSSEFFEFLVRKAHENPENSQLPSLKNISDELGISVAQLREQLEVAKALGLVEIRPRTGIKRQPYTFYSAVWKSISYALQIDPHYFDLFSNFRKHIELAYWYEAVATLILDDHLKMKELLTSALRKLEGTPIRIPHQEHRELHLLIYRRLENPFVLGILEAYWDSYEAIGLSLFTDLDYLKNVWDYHRKMVTAICCGDSDAGYLALAEHADLIRYRPESSTN
jgi:DNA-binding FadR family transcriptional regulator